MKEKYIKAHMKAAGVYAELSTAQRLQVGCVIVKDNTIIGIGYNGMPSGWNNMCEEVEYVLKEECYKTDEWMKNAGFTETVHGWTRLKSKPEVLHAEMNAVLKAAKTGNAVQDSTLYITLMPCLDCAKYLLQSGIKRVVYLNEYRNLDGVNFLKQFLKVEQYEI